jgi:hypothetical protein
MNIYLDSVRVNYRTLGTHMYRLEIFSLFPFPFEIVVLSSGWFNL